MLVYRPLDIPAIATRCLNGRWVVAARSTRRRAALAWISVIALNACAAPPPNEHETGSSGKLIRYSSRQVSVDLTDAQRQELDRLRDRKYPDAPAGHVLDAVATALSKQGFAPVSVDRETGIVEAERDHVLVPKWREVIRGAVKAKFGWLPAKPDHERVAAIVAVRSESGKNDTLVRVRFDRTVWDSNGDSSTETVVQRDVYEGFFDEVDRGIHENGR
jgi:hypothetical protein